VLPRQPEQPERRRGTHSATSILRTDIKSDPPLPHQHAIRHHQWRSRMIDVGGFGRDAIELDDFEPRTGAKRVDPAMNPHIEASEIESVEATGYGVEAFFELRREHPTSIKEHGSPAMRAEFHQRKCFTISRHDPQLVAVPVAIQSRGADGPLIVQNQLLQRASAIADYGRKLLLGDRGYPP